MGDATPPLQVGRAYGGDRWRVEALLGNGAFGFIYRVRDAHRQRSMAMKVMLHSDEDVTASIEAERQAYALINRHWPRDGADRLALIRCEEEVALGLRRSLDTTAFLVEQYGPSVLDVLCLNKGIPFAPDTVVDIAKQLLGALRFLHEDCGLVHLDVKPENVLFESGAARECAVARFEGCYGTRTYRMLDDARVRLIDFNSSLAVRGDEEIEGACVTMHYRAPEILLNLLYGPRADVFALGALTMELFLGCTLFEQLEWVECAYSQSLVLGAPPQSMLEQSWERRAVTARQENVPLLVKYAWDAEEEAAVYSMHCGREEEEGDEERGKYRGFHPLKYYFRPLTDPAAAEMYGLVRSLMTVDPSRRPTASEALAMPIFSKKRGAAPKRAGSPSTATSAAAAADRKTPGASKRMRKME